MSTRWQGAQDVYGIHRWLSGRPLPVFPAGRPQALKVSVQNEATGTNEIQRMLQRAKQRMRQAGGTLGNASARA